MVQLSKKNIQFTNTPSSKGNQLKFTDGHIWYKTDYTGYEGLSEYVVSELLTYSNLEPLEFVRYRTETIVYGESTLLGCKSPDFLPHSSQLITLERLYKKETGESLYQTIWKIPDREKRAATLVNYIQNITGIDNFGLYLAKLLTIDTLFLNEDRHFHNIAVLMDSTEKYSLCPIFDNGAALFSDTKLDYPVGSDLTSYYKRAQAKTFSPDFDEQLDIIEELFGRPLQFHFTKDDVRDILSAEPYYPDELKQRVGEILFHQMNRYSYLLK